MPQLKIESQNDEAGFRIPYKLMLWLRHDTRRDVSIKDYSKNWVLEVEKWLKENGLMGEDTMKKKVMREKCREIEHEDSAKSLKKYLGESGCMLGKEAAIPYDLIRTGDRKRIPYYLRELLPPGLAQGRVLKTQLRLGVLPLLIHTLRREKSKW